MRWVVDYEHLFEWSVWQKILFSKSMWQSERFLHLCPDRLLRRHPDRLLGRHPDRLLRRHPDRLLRRHPDRLLRQHPGRLLPGRYPFSRLLASFFTFTSSSNQVRKNGVPVQANLYKINRVPQRKTKCLPLWLSMPAIRTSVFNFAQAHRLRSRSHARMANLAEKKNGVPSKIWMFINRIRRYFNKMPWHHFSPWASKLPRSPIGNVRQHCSIGQGQGHYNTRISKNACMALSKSNSIYYKYEITNATQMHTWFSLHGHGPKFRTSEAKVTRNSRS